MAEQAKAAEQPKEPVWEDEMGGTRPDLHVACYGSPGSRKSTFFSTFPQPIIVKQFDARGKDLPYWKLGRVTRVQRDKRGQEFREIITPKGDLACVIEYFHDPIVDEPKAATMFLENLNRVPREIDKGRCRTLVFDTVTSASLTSRKMYEYDLKAGAKDPRKWYGGAVDTLEEVLLIQLPAMACNVCVGLHVSKIKVESEGSMVYAPYLPGRLMESFASQWPEVYRAYVDKPKGEKIWRLQTEASEKYEAASQIGAPDPCEGDYPSLWHFWDRDNKKKVAK